METIGATTFIKDGFKYDYNFQETIQSLKWADQITVVCIATEDGTPEACLKMADDKTKIIVLDDTIWNLLSGKDRLSHFSNIGIANLQTDWTMYVQADEVLHEDSIPWINQAVHEDVDAFMCRRYNLWNTPYQVLNVPINRRPCSSEVIRLARNQFRCVDDAESIGVDGRLSFAYLDRIEIFHMGFVRRREVMKSKIINMQQGVFGMEHYDPKLDRHDLFEPMDYFSEADLIPLPKALPGVIQKWAEERYPQ